MATTSLNCIQVVDPTSGTGKIESSKPVRPSVTANNGWKAWNSGSGEFYIHGKKWMNDSRLDCSGDPTSRNDWARIRLNTGANHDCNCFWGAPNNNSAQERLIRGLYFRHHTNGAKFRPRITGVALQFQNGSDVKWMGLRDRWNATGNNKMYNSGGTLPYEGTSTGNYFWGVAKRGTGDGNYFHDPNWRWSGVLFHYETTWKSGSAINCDVYLKYLTPIFDSSTNSTPQYNNKYRVWGYQYK